MIFFHYYRLTRKQMAEDNDSLAQAASRVTFRFVCFLFICILFTWCQLTYLQITKTILSRTKRGWIFSVSFPFYILEGEGEKMEMESRRD